MIVYESQLATSTYCEKNYVPTRIVCLYPIFMDCLLNIHIVLYYIVDQKYIFLQIISYLKIVYLPELFIFTQYLEDTCPMIREVGPTKLHEEPNLNSNKESNP